MQDRRIRPHGLAEFHDRGQRFIFNLDHLQCFGGDVDGRCSHRGHRMAGVERFVACQDIVALIAQGIRHHICRQVSGGDHRFDPREGFGLGGIDGSDAGMGVRATEHRAVKHLRQTDIRAKNSLPCYLF